MRSIHNFLNKILSQQCQSGDYVIFSVKGPGIPWKDVPLVYGPNFKKEVSNFFIKYPPTKFDLYWSPMPYSGPRRQLRYTLDTKFLAQDVDEHDHPDQLDPAPSYIWESSPNKYQALWELDRYIKEEEYTPLNKALSEHISAAAECFDFTHVYRIPGTLNHKYKNHPEVKLPISTNKLYKPKDLKRILKMNKVVGSKPLANNSSLTERKIYAKYSIPQKVRDLLALENLSGVDRSNTIWFIENKLHELGMTPNEIIYLVKNSTFNKYKGRKDEDLRLKDELGKILDGSITGASAPENTFKLTSYLDVMSNQKTFEGWLVKGFWGRRSHGIVAGMPKCFKSTLVHDLAVSIASGRPFLGKYPVMESGPVLMVQNENADYIMKDRTEKLLDHRDLGGRFKVKEASRLRVEFPPELPIHFLNQQGFNLSSEDHRKALEEMVKEIKPVLVILDPLYLMFQGDLNSAKDLNPLLNWLLHIKNEYKTSVMLIHHYNKGGVTAGKGGSRMMGSIILYGWIESAWYLAKGEEEENDSQDPELSKQTPSVVTLNREFRMAGQFPEVDIHLTMGEIGNPYYEVDVTLAGQGSVTLKNLNQEIINLLETSSLPLNRLKINELLAVESKKLRRALDDLVADKRIICDGKGYRVYKQPQKGYNQSKGGE